MHNDLINKMGITQVLDPDTIKNLSVEELYNMGYITDSSFLSYIEEYDVLEDSIEEEIQAPIEKIEVIEDDEDEDLAPLVEE